jgi:hypothetical protein
LRFFLFFVLLVASFSLGWEEAGVARFNVLHKLVGERRKEWAEKAKDKMWMERMVTKREEERRGKRKRKSTEISVIGAYADIRMDESDDEDNEADNDNGLNGGDNDVSQQFSRDDDNISQRERV